MNARCSSVPSLDINTLIINQIINRNFQTYVSDFINEHQNHVRRSSFYVENQTIASKTLHQRILLEPNISRQNQSPIYTKIQNSDPSRDQTTQKQIMIIRRTEIVVGSKTRLRF